MTPIGLSERYLRTPGQCYSPFTLGPPIQGSLPKTPTLSPPPPPPHAVVGEAFPLASPTSPFDKNGFSPKKTNGGATVFFPTTITANGDAKLTPISSFVAGAGLVHLPDGSRASSVNSPIMKLENGVCVCVCVGGGIQ